MKARYPFVAGVVAGFVVAAEALVVLVKRGAISYHPTPVPTSEPDPWGVGPGWRVGPASRAQTERQP